MQTTKDMGAAVLQRTAAPGSATSIAPAANRWYGKRDHDMVKRTKVTKPVIEVKSCIICMGRNGPELRNFRRHLKVS